LRISWRPALSGAPLDVAKAGSGGLAGAPFLDAVATPSATPGGGSVFGVLLERWRRPWGDGCGAFAEKENRKPDLPIGLAALDEMRKSCR